jgi:hypothetical protein
MDRKPYVFGYDAEPSTERPTGFGQTAFDSAIAPTAPAPWQVTQHSTFDEPSHAFQHVAAIRREHELRARLGIAAAVISVAAIASLAFW